MGGAVVDSAGPGCCGVRECAVGRVAVAAWRPLGDRRLCGLGDHSICRRAQAEIRQGHGDRGGRLCGGELSAARRYSAALDAVRLSEGFILTGEAAMSTAAAGGKGAALARLAASFPV